MLVDYYQTWTQSTDSYKILHTYKKNEKMMDINATFWHLPSVVDNGEIWTKSTHSFLRYLNKHIKFKKNVAIIIQIWHRAKCYFTYQQHRYLITVRNINKNQPILWNITTNIQNVWKIGHNYSNLAKCQMLFYKHEQCIIPDTKYEKVSQQTLKIYEKMPTITQIWHRAKFYFTCISSPWYLIMVPNMK